MKLKISRSVLFVGFAFWVGMVTMRRPVHAQTDPAVHEYAEPEPLLRGPIHEGFAEPVLLDAEPSLVIPEAPPEPINEIPPDVQPEGDSVQWLPGYWAWDEERLDFLWVSGVWRAPPPDRRWVPGYWTQIDSGYQWGAGFWAERNQQKITYLPFPRKTLEQGPNGPAPAAELFWVPGCWMRRGSSYAWRPGYWARAEPEWVWIPAHYVWTPRGSIFVAGFWDYPLERRGMLFAPVYFEVPVYAEPGYYYSPAMVIDVKIVSSHLFVHRRYCHYYYGDYYADSYLAIGVFPWFSFHLHHGGYDPLFVYHHWHHRHDRGWVRHLHRQYDLRRAHAELRPPRTLAAQQKFVHFKNGKPLETARLARPLREVVAQGGGTTAFRRLSAKQRNTIRDSTNAARQLGARRREHENARGGGKKRFSSQSTAPKRRGSQPARGIIEKPGKRTVPSKARDRILRQRGSPFLPPSQPKKGGSVSGGKRSGGTPKSNSAPSRRKPRSGATSPRGPSRGGGKGRRK